MKIIVLNGSPKGETSVTMQYVRYIQQQFPQHECEIVSVAQNVKRLERDESAFHEIIERVRKADGVLWAFPLYILVVHGNYKRFIELIWEKGAAEAFAGKYAATLSTSIHFFDHTAHNYMRAICDDLGMRYVGAFSADMPDLLKEEGQHKLRLFAEDFFRAIEQQTPAVRAFPPITWRVFEYVPGPVIAPVDTGGKRIVVVTDSRPDEVNLARMVERFKCAFAQEIEIVNLNDLDIKGGCLGCLKCGYNYECAYLGKDAYIDFYNSRLKPADAIIFAGAIHDRYLSALWKTFFDRSFFNTHTPSLVGKQFGFIISGPLGQNANLREILSAWSELERSNVAGFVTDEYGDAAEIDAQLQHLAGQVARLAASGYVAPQTFLGVGGTKIFRDDVWGRLRLVFQADHRAYRRMGIYDFPQKDIGMRVQNALLSLALKIPRVRQEFTKRIKEGMIQSYQKVLQA